MKHTKSLYIISILILSLTLKAQSQEDASLANNLIQLRGQVDDLQSELDILKSEHKTSMAYLNTRKTELSADIDRKEMRIKQSQLEIEQLQNKIKQLGTGSEQLIPDVQQFLAQIKKSLGFGIPFKLTERLSVIEEIERKLNARKMTSQNAIIELWAFIEDEIRLTRENAIYSQTISLDGENVLVDVAKIGTVMMYFKTRDDKYGHVKNLNGQWKYELIRNNKKSQLVATLFDSLSKQIRQGYFKLPLAISVGASK